MKKRNPFISLAVIISFVGLSVAAYAQTPEIRPKKPELVQIRPEFLAFKSMQERCEDAETITAGLSIFSEFNTHLGGRSYCDMHVVLRDDTGGGTYVAVSMQHPQKEMLCDSLRESLLSAHNWKLYLEMKVIPSLDPSEDNLVELCELNITLPTISE